MPAKEDVPVHQGPNGIFFNDPVDGNEIRLIHEKYLVIHSTTADPASPLVGQLWFRSDI